ncbi:hypothetical protein EVAR_53195_1 [Eumeta japonica]|uniref:(+)RNA virus helicase C-terminal domain-containing protein n=1 Tax=Eumeta variegata TaxID=151549 RepID=A0A4C1Z0D3_EUMVA|nr:hypothetical protein EVAR_53195_1 [Eumeta japonica]
MVTTETNSISLPQTLYLAHTQTGKTELKAMGCGQGKESRVLTIHEAQGLASKNVVIVRTASKKAEIYNSIQHAVVAITRHTENCIYLTVNCSDAIGRLIQRANNATSERIIEYNAKMAIRSRPIPVKSGKTTNYPQLRPRLVVAARRALVDAPWQLRCDTSGCPLDNKSRSNGEKIDAEGRRSRKRCPGGRTPTQTGRKGLVRDRSPASRHQQRGKRLGDKKGCRRKTTGNLDFTRKRREALTASGERLPKELPAPAPKSRPMEAVGEFQGRRILDEIARPSRWPQRALGHRSRRSERRSEAPVKVGTEEEFGAINRAATKIVACKRCEGRLEALRNSKGGQDLRMQQLQIITELTLRLEESRPDTCSKWSEKSRASAGHEETERRLRRESEKYNNKYK